MKEVEPEDLVVGKTYFATNLFLPIYEEWSEDETWSRQAEREKKFIVTVSGKRYEPTYDAFTPWRIELKNVKQIKGISSKSAETLQQTGGKWTEIPVFSHFATGQGLTLSPWNIESEETVPKFYERGAQMDISIRHVVNQTKDEVTKRIRKLKKNLKSIGALKEKEKAEILNEAEQKKLDTEVNMRNELKALLAEEDRRREEQKLSGGPSTSSFSKLPHDLRGLIQDFGGVQGMGGGRKRKTRRRKRSKTHSRKRSKTRRKRKSRRKRRKSRSGRK